MTNYGTIPTSSGGDSSSSSSFSAAKDRIKDGLGTLRPWKSMLDIRSFGLPPKHSQHNRPPQDEFSLLPDELRRNCFGDLVPQPPLAPDLANRLHRRNGRQAFPLLSPLPLPLPLIILQIQIRNTPIQIRKKWWIFSES
ncbi:unnamed protein product [Linum tenue]|uniref:Uncharacterized protein n=1 Tax=Linum tenue TaxID=586396 RepID=A0AAV0H7M7_9ROSI|nr:unnamed protein product [Linum tenue]